MSSSSLGSRAWLALVTALVAALLAGTSSLALPSVQLHEKLAEDWRWREIAPPEGATGDPRAIGPGAGDQLLGIFEERVHVHDGWVWTPLAGAPTVTLSTRAQVAGVPGAVLLVDSTVAWRIQAGEQAARIAELDPQSRNCAIARDQDGRLLVADAQGVYEFTADGLTLVHAPPPAQAHVGGIAYDATGRAWCSTDLGFFRSTPGGWEPVAPGDPPSARELVQHVIPVGGSVYFLPAMFQGSRMGWVFDGVRLSRRELRSGTADVFDHVVVAGQGTILAPWSIGLAVLGQDGSLLPVRLPDRVPSDVRRLALVGDRYLVAMGGGGRVFSCDLSADRWRSFRPERESASSTVLALAPSGRGGTWVGTTFGVYRWVDGSFVEDHAEAAGVLLRTVTALHEDAEGVLWVGSGADINGVLSLSGPAWELHQEPHGVGRFKVHSVRPGVDGDTWFLLLGEGGSFAETAGGAVRLRGGQWTRFTTAEGLPDNRCYDLLVPPDGRPVVATYKGLARLEGERWTLVPGAPAADFRALGLLPDGSLVASRGLQYKHGTYRLDEDGSSGPWDCEAGRSTGAGAFRVGSDGATWWTSHLGLFRADNSGCGWVGAEPGLPSRQFWPINTLPGGTVLAGSEGAGLVRHAPDDEDPPRVTSVVLRQDPRTGRTLLAWAGVDRHDVTPVEALRFETRVDGTAWKARGSATEALLGALGPGAHVVEVRALDGAGNASPTPFRLDFSLPLPPWRTPAALALGAGILLALGFLAALLLRQVRRGREVSRQLHFIVDNTSELVTIRSLVDGRYLYVSPAAERLTGLTPAEYARRAHELPVPDHPGTIGELPERDGGTGVASRLAAIRRVDGEIRILRIRQDRAVLHGEDVLLEVASDVTEIRRIADEMRQEDKRRSLGILAGGVAHDFNNILATVVANASVLRSQAAPGSPDAEALDDILSAGDRAADLCRQVLSYAGRDTPRQRVVDLRDVVKETAGLMRSVLPQGVTLSVDLGSEPVPVDGDPTQLGQVVLNLLTNALEAHAGRPGGVTVTCGEDRRSGTSGSPRGVVVEVSDTGCGMDAEVQRRLFEPFFTTKFEGRGLGLSATRGIVVAHGGTVSVLSERGAGSRFLVALPRSLGLPAALHEAAGPAAASGQPRPSCVLVMDDDAGVRTVATRILEDAGHRVLSADEGAAGVALLAQHLQEVDAVLLDVSMPGQPFAETLSALQRLTAAPVIVMSGHDQGGVDVSRTAAFVPKPFRPRDLVEAVSAHLRGS